MTHTKSGHFDGRGKETSFFLKKCHQFIFWVWKIGGIYKQIGGWKHTNWINIKYLCFFRFVVHPSTIVDRTKLWWYKLLCSDNNRSCHVMFYQLVGKCLSGAKTTFEDIWWPMVSCCSRLFKAGKRSKDMHIYLTYARNFPQMTSGKWLFPWI